MNEKIAQTYRDTVHSHGHRAVELEFRAGRRVLNGSFVAGVPKNIFDDAMALLETCEGAVKTYVETFQRINGTDVRYVVTNGDDATGKWEYKKKIASIDRDICGGFTQRASIALEGNHNTAPPPGGAPYTHHRMKKRTSFRYKSWSFDFTRVTSNLPSQLDADEPIYEIEIELVDQDALYMYTFDHVVAWGDRLLDELLAHVCKT